MKLRLLARYALHAIRSERQRVLIAVVAVAFGVMSVVSMSILAESFLAVMVPDPRYEIGGDAQLWRDNHYLSDEDLAMIEALQAEGTIERYATLSNQSALVLKTPDSGHVTFLRSGIGFTPGAYPLLGTLELGVPAGASAIDVLQEPGDVIITRDIAEDRGLQVGDPILVASQLGGASQPLRVAGIAVRTPNSWGSALYFDLDTAATLSQVPHPVTDVAVLWRNGDREAARAALAGAGWYIHAPDTLNESTLEIRSTFNLMLKGAGILGLMVGGIGIANTMQVLLMRRRREVAVLKALGYARRDILLLFTIETAIIGLAGSLVGAAAGVVLSALLVDVAGNVAAFLLTWSVDPLLVAGALLVGMVTTLLFAANAIVQASEVRPAHVFRHLPQAQGARLRTLGVFALMALPFAAITSLIMGSLWQGVIVMLAALAGLLLIGGLLGSITWLVLRLMPVFRLYLLRLARNNVRSRRSSLTFAMIALFVGAFTLGLSITIIHSSQEQFAIRMLSDSGYNLTVLLEPDGIEAAEAVLSEVSTHIGVRYEAPLQAIETVDGESLSAAFPTLTLQSRQTLWDIEIFGEPWDAGLDVAYLPAYVDLAGVTRVTITGIDGRRIQLPVAGFYSVLGTWNSMLLPAPQGILVPMATLLSIAGEEVRVLAAAQIPASQMQAAAEHVGLALPDATVITTADVNESFNATFRNLFTFSIIMAGLALAAGAVLIANAVSLTMGERRYEIGVMKALGYTRRQVLFTILAEYGLIATIATTLGLIAVVAFLYVTALVQELELAADALVLPPQIALLILGVGIGVTLLAVLMTAWAPTSLRPVVVLNEQG